jgi:hypothetical protein
MAYVTRFAPDLHGPLFGKEIGLGYVSSPEPHFLR